MKRSKIVIGASAFLLAVVGVYATKVSRKAATPRSAVVYNGNMSIADMTSFTSLFNTVSTGKNLVQLVRTNGGSPPTVIGTVQTSPGAITHKVYHQ